jgi:hypothetical protein
MPNATATPNASPTPPYAADVESTIADINELMRAVADIKGWAGLWTFTADANRLLGEAASSEDVASGKQAVTEFCRNRGLSQAVLDLDTIWPPSYRRLDEAVADLCGLGFAVTCCSATSLTLFAEDLEADVTPIYESLALQTQYELRNLVTTQAEQREQAK